MAGYAELLQTRIVDRGRHGPRIHTSIRPGWGNLIDDLLAFSRIGRARARGDGQPEQLLKEALKKFGRTRRGAISVWRIEALPAIWRSRDARRAGEPALERREIRTRAQAEVKSVRSMAQAMRSSSVRDNGVGK
jgi:hypothetical protein